MPSITIPKSVVELGDYFVGSDTITNRFNYTGIIIGYRGSALPTDSTIRELLSAIVVLRLNGMPQKEIFCLRRLIEVIRHDKEKDYQEHQHKGQPISV